MKPVRPYFRIFKDCLKIFQVKTLNCVLTATISSGWGVQHPMCSLYKILGVCRRNNADRKRIKERSTTGRD